MNLIFDMQNFRITRFPKYVIAFNNPENPHVPYYCIKGTGQWTEVPKTIGDLYYDPIEDTLQYQKIKEKVEKLIEKESNSIEYEFGSCHRIWAYKKKILKRRYGINWNSPRELNPTCNFD